MATTPNLDEFHALNGPTSRKRPCKIGTAAAALNGEATVLKAACESDDITAGAIVKWLEKRGYPSNVSAVASHRAGKCTCAG